MINSKSINSNFDKLKNDKLEGDKLEGDKLKGEKVCRWANDPPECPHAPKMTPLNAGMSKLC